MAEIESLKRARKARERAEKQITAAENRTRYGRSKADKQHEAKEKAAEQVKLDGHKRQE
jgi:Domain of unknown function (DUF4169)